MSQLKRETDTLRRLELWGTFSIDLFVEEYVQDVDWVEEGVRFRGNLIGTEQRVGGALGRTPFYSTIVSLEPTMMLTFNEDHDDRVRRGYDHIEWTFADLCASLSVDARFSHGVFADTNVSSCLFFWSPDGRWIVDMSIPDRPENDYRVYRNSRVRTYFQPALESLLAEAGVLAARRTFELDWEDRRTGQHAIVSDGGANL